MRITEPRSKLRLITINVHLGNMVPAPPDWTSFALTLLSVIGLTAVVVTEYRLKKAQLRIRRKAGEGVLALQLLLWRR
ncbi:hypothetical protein B9Z19DRAFT_1080683 [Tuber borchii]|uniref:Uncharacterized protein n=1 Tax=Tuber borchii TaxID=42251 RepID=A0A2T6ZWI9_TUBBO|nr:hypothetical protein B9Z19DRAFT_1080683 [Tuber borchii]